MHTKPWVRARASKEYWQNMKPAGEEQFSFLAVPSAYRKPFFKKCLFRSARTSYRAFVCPAVPSRPVHPSRPQQFFLSS